MTTPDSTATRLASAAPDPLAGKAILLLPYSHMDWAWCFSRRWHQARYTAIFDEALRLAAADPDFRLFVDSLAEFQRESTGRSLLDFLNAQSDYRAVQIAYLQLIGSYMTATAQLNLAVGHEVLP